MTTTEKNRIIAEFMGLKKDSPNTIWFYSLNQAKYYRENELIYHSDWNWLMGVVEKIESFIEEISSLSFQITNNHISILVNASPLWADIRQFSSISKIESVYSACVEFIQWYTQNKN